jgi:hypothetical protein
MADRRAALPIGPATLYHPGIARRRTLPVPASPRGDRVVMAMIRCADLALLALDLGKATFDNVFVSVSTIQDLVEDGASGLARRVPLVPAPLPAVFGEWVTLSHRLRADVKETVDRTYRRLRSLAEDDDGEAGAAPARPAHRPGTPRAA